MSTNSQKVVLNNVNVYFATNLAVLEARLKCKNQDQDKSDKNKTTGARPRLPFARLQDQKKSKGSTVY